MRPSRVVDPLPAVREPIIARPQAAALRELALLVVCAAILTAALTYPMAFRIGSVGRADTADGQYSLWNVAWVSHALLERPSHLFDANIFYRHRRTLAYSESNFVAGLIGLPMYWATHNPYATLNFAVLVSFLLTAAGTYYLVLQLLDDRRAAAVSAICFAFCPHMFGHLAQIQALMTLGIPLSMLAFHRLADRPAAGRGTALGLAMALQALASGYYGVFIVLMVGFAVVVVAWTRGLWRDQRYWRGIAIGAVVAMGIVAPFYVPYGRLQRLGFGRTLEDADGFVANWSSYLASSSYAHAWMLQFLPRWSDVNFPGIVATIFGVGGCFVARTKKEREVVFVYGGLTVLALWMSFGPAAGLYTAVYRAVPMMAWLRTPSRFGLIVAFGLSVLAGLSVKRLATMSRHGTLVGVVVAAVTVGELALPLGLSDAIPVAPVYRVLATLPRGPVIEMPFYYPQVGLYQHTKYMLASTTHWMPLVNGYSDYIPPDFYQNVMTLASFPSREALKVLERRRVRYAVFHLYGYDTQNRTEALTRLAELAPYFRSIYADETTQLYEIVGYPK